MAAVRRGKVLVELTFGHASPQAALRRLSSRGLDPAGPFDDPVDEPAWVTRLQAYARGEIEDFAGLEVELGPKTPFQRRVLECCRAIPYGQTRTYAQLADEAGYPRAARAVGSVMSSNRIPLVIPCHRVVGSSGGLGGYSAPGGIRLKLRLLESEAAGRGAASARPRSRTPLQGSLRTP
jgi:methylated-DNA-[protein]-cysteine S-methyltransferase